MAMVIIRRTPVIEINFAREILAIVQAFLLLEMQFLGPFEGEDLDVNLILKEEPADLAERDYRIHRYLLDKGFDVLIGYDVLDGFDEL
jgi:hypothetical protein